MLNTPHMQSLLSNPDVMRSLINMNPQMKQLMETNPELGHMLNDPQFMQRSIEAFRNPSVMRELMRNTDRAMSNIESIPGGFSALKKLYEEVQVPMWEAQTGSASSQASGLTSQVPNYTNQSQSGPSSQPLPNPWKPEPPANLPAADPNAMAVMMQDPNMQRMMGSMFSGGSGQPAANNPLANPDLLGLMFDPSTMAAMAQLEASLTGVSGGQTPASLSGLHATSPAANFSNSFASFLGAVNDNPEIRFRPQLQLLKNMGFTDTEACVQALHQSGGNVNRAVDILLAESANK
jgi:ubiquilin